MGSCPVREGLKWRDTETKGTCGGSEVARILKDSRSGGPAEYRSWKQGGRAENMVLGPEERPDSA